MVLAQSKRSVFVENGKTIFEALLEAGTNPAHSCMEGVCGTCETRVLEGIPEHRDLVLNDAEKAAGKTMMICCSGAKTPTLVLDLSEPSDAQVMAGALIVHCCLEVINERRDTSQ